eukprot:5291962-Amphidinium_carterae.1
METDGLIEARRQEKKTKWWCWHRYSTRSSAQQSLVDLASASRLQGWNSTKARRRRKLKPQTCEAEESSSSYKKGGRPTFTLQSDNNFACQTAPMMGLILITCLVGVGGRSGWTAVSNSEHIDNHASPCWCDSKPTSASASAVNTDAFNLTAVLQCLSRMGLVLSVGTWCTKHQPAFMLTTSLRLHQRSGHGGTKHRTSVRHQEQSPIRDGKNCIALLTLPPIKTQSYLQAMSSPQPPNKGRDRVHVLACETYSRPTVPQLPTAKYHKRKTRQLGD